VSFEEIYLREAHKHCAANRDEITASSMCACFYCRRTYRAAEVTEFLDDGTALCPECPVDAVIGDASGFPVTQSAFLDAMHEFWFERTVELSADRSVSSALKGLAQRLFPKKNSNALH
jgi:hypothetical protein